MIQHVSYVMLGRGSDIRLRMTMKSRDDEEVKKTLLDGLQVTAVLSASGICGLVLVKNDCIGNYDVPLMTLLEQPRQRKWLYPPALSASKRFRQQEPGYVVFCDFQRRIAFVAVDLRR